VTLRGSFFINRCSNTSFTITKPDDATLVIPDIRLSCTAQNGAGYTTTVFGTTLTLSNEQWEQELPYSFQPQGSYSVTFSDGSLRQTNSFIGDTISGTLTPSSPD